MKIPLRPFVGLLLALPMALFSVWADVNAEEASNDQPAALLQEQREEKKLLFNQYVEDELARREREKYRARTPQTKASAPAKQKTWVVKFNSLFGYDSNVSLNSSRRGDGFHQETLTGTFRTPRPDLAWIPWDGKLGFSGYIDFYNYDNVEISSYQTNTFSAFSEEQIAEKWLTRVAYEFTVLRYPKSDAVGYNAQRIKPSLTYSISDTASLSLFSNFERRDYGRRKALNGSNLPSDDDRQDLYFEVGVNPKFYPTPQTYLAANVALKNNDSNDSYLDYNDYYGWKANALFYQRIGGPLSVALLAGYDFKQYRGLTFYTLENGPFETQADNLMYEGLYLYYDINPACQLVYSYLYKQNYSNNPLQDWSGYTTSLGLNLTF